MSPKWSPPGEGACDASKGTSREKQPKQPEQPEQQEGRARQSNNQVSSAVIMNTGHTGKGQFSSFILFAALIVLLNLCPPFQLDFDNDRQQVAPINRLQLPSQQQYLSYFETSLQFVRLVFRSPLRLDARTTRYSLAEARVLGKMAKVWYIKKKIKKLSKKLKKHTIAVPVFTAIPIYEHSY